MHNKNIEPKPELLFKESFLPEINQKSYESYNLVTGKIIKITKDNIYFDVGLQNIVKTGKRQFLKNFYEVEKLIHSRYATNKNYTFNSFVENITVGKSFKFIVYRLDSAQARVYIQFERTIEYIKDNLFFYEFDLIKRTNSSLFGYVLNTVNGGFSVGINGLVAFVPNNHMMKQQPKNFNKSTSTKQRRFRPIGTRTEFKILNINFKRKNVVLAKKDLY